MAPHTIAGSHPRRDVPPRRDRPRPTWRSIPLRGFEEDALDAQWDVLHVGQHAPAFQAAISFGCGSSGHARQAPLSELRSAEAAVSAHLPITTGVDRVVLMAGRRYRRPLMLAVHSQYGPCGSGGSAPCMRPSTDGTGEPASDQSADGQVAGPASAVLGETGSDSWPQRASTPRKSRVEVDSYRFAGRCMLASSLVAVGAPVGPGT